jgi:hypothetical protein
MATFQKYPAGSYVLRIKQNTLGETATGTPFVAIQVEVVSGKNIKDPSVRYGETRTVNLWLSEKAIPYTKAFLEYAGFTGSIAQLDIDHPEHISLEGFEADGSCKLEEYQGKVYDKFGFYPPKSKFGSKMNKVNTSRMLMLDALFGVSTIQAPVKRMVSPALGKSVQVQTEPGQDFEDSEDLPF